MLACAEFRRSRLETLIDMAVRATIHDGNLVPRQKLDLPNEKQMPIVGICAEVLYFYANRQPR